MIRFVSKYLVLSLLIVVMTIGMLSSLFSFQEVLQRITSYKNLSAWSLAQLELEYQQLTVELKLYQAGKSDAEKVGLAYDVAWNRMDVFLHGKENENIRHSHDTEAIVNSLFLLIKEHEDYIDNLPPADSPVLDQWIQSLDSFKKPIRQIMINNFTGPGITRGMEEIRDLVKRISFILTFVSLLTLFVGFFLYREAKRHWHLSLHDPLTGLINRANFKRLLKTRCEALSVQKTPHLFGLVDISHFNEVNNLFGYNVGDELLKKIGDYLNQIYRKDSVLIGRISSSGFAVFGNESVIESSLKSMMSGLQLILKEYDPAGRMIVRIGISHFPEQAVKSTDLFQYAELALQEAKKFSEPKLCEFNDQMLQKVQRKRELAIHLRQGLINIHHHNLYLCYQPIHKLKGDKIGVEALIRWQHPLLGFIPPPELIEVAEEYGLGGMLGDWIFQRVIHDMESLPAEHLERLEISINLSDSIFNTELPEKLAQLLSKSTVGENQLILEVTETIALQDFTSSQIILKSLRSNGIRIALDDFGTGFSSLSYLKDLPVDKLKIDKSFIMNIHRDARLHQMVTHITNLAHDLSLVVVAEGVETIDEHDTVKAIGISEIQGYYLAKPLTLEQLQAYLANYFQTAIAL